MHRSTCAITIELDDEFLLLINSRTGAVHRLPRRWSFLLSNGVSANEVLDAEAAQCAATLRSYGYLVDAPDVDARGLEALGRHIAGYWRAKPSQHSVALTHSCFFRCTYCFESGTIAHALSLTPDDMTPLIDAVRALAEATGDGRKMPDVALYGGEPLQPRMLDTVAELFAVAEARRIALSAVTNGYFLDLFLPLLHRYAPLVAGIQVAVDGPEAIHDARRPLASGKGTFARISENIDQALRAGIAVRLRTNVDLGNVDALTQLGTYLLERGWTAYPGFSATLVPVERHGCVDGSAHDERLAVLTRFLVMSEAGNRPELSVFNAERMFGFARFLEARVQRSRTLVLPKFSYCDAHTGRGFSFGADGYIYPCHKTLERPEARVGRFLPDYELFAERLSAWMQRTVLNMPRCRRCPVATFCGGGCAYEQIVLGRPFAEPNCEAHDDVFRRYAHLRRELIRANIPVIA